MVDRSRSAPGFFGWDELQQGQHSQGNGQWQGGYIAHGFEAKGTNDRANAE
jgi:hypothetical protein